MNFFFAFCSPRWHVIVKTRVSAPPNSTVTNACHSVWPGTTHTIVRTGARRALSIAVIGGRLNTASVSVHPLQHVKYAVPCSLGHLVKLKSEGAFLEGRGCRKRNKKLGESCSMTSFRPPPPSYWFLLPTRCAYQRYLGEIQLVV